MRLCPVTLQALYVPSIVRYLQHPQMFSILETTIEIDLNSPKRDYYL